MKLAIVFSTFITSTLATFTLQAANLTVTIDNIDIQRGGNVRIGLYSEKEKFLSTKPLQGKELAAKRKKLTFVFKNLPAGRYAVSSFQDINHNKQLDRNFLGMPNEPYGLSGKPRWGKPEFKYFSFAVGAQNKTISIRFN